MEFAWLEDFLELVATRNFLAAAAARNISQPAFSRRIMALESWIGAQLVDRTTYPVRMTPAGSLFLPRAQELVQNLYRSRIECQQQADPERQRFTFAALHTIAMFRFPRWICEVEKTTGPVLVGMHADDYRECVEQLSLGKCDFAIMYDFPDGPPVLQAGPFTSILIGIEPLVPVSALDRAGNPLYSPGKASDKPIPYLAYSWNDGYIGRLVSIIHARQETPLSLSTVYEASLAEGIKRMAIAGKGIGWLPLSCVSDAIARGELCQVGGPELTLDMQVRIYRRQGGGTSDIDGFWSRITPMVVQPVQTPVLEPASRAKRATPSTYAMRKSHSTGKVL